MVDDDATYTIGVQICLRIMYDTVMSPKLFQQNLVCVDRGIRYNCQVL